MQTQTFDTKHLVRTFVVAAFIVMLALTTTQRAGATDSDTSVADSVRFQVALCEAGGGTATVTIDRSVSGGLSASVTCSGGLLDGMTCLNVPFGTSCHFRSIGPDVHEFEPDGQVDVHKLEADQPLESIDVVADADMTEDVVVAETELGEESVDPGIAEEPMTGESDGSVDDLPEIVDETIDPVVVDETGGDIPIIEEVPVVEESVDPGVVDGTYVPVIETISGQELPVFIGQ